MKNNRQVYPISLTLFTLLQACGGGSSTTENSIEPIEEVTENGNQTTPVTDEARVNDRDRERTRSPQGISDDVESRRYKAKEKAYLIPMEHLTMFGCGANLLIMTLALLTAVKMSLKISLYQQEMCSLTQRLRVKLLSRLTVLFTTLIQETVPKM